MLNDLPKGTWRTGIILRFIFLASNFNFFLQLMIFRISGSHPTEQLVEAWDLPLRTYSDGLFHSYAFVSD